MFSSAAIPPPIAIISLANAYHPSIHCLTSVVSPYNPTLVSHPTMMQLRRIVQLLQSIPFRWDIPMPQLSTLLRLSRARLSRQIVFWVFLSIVLIEIIILVPSYYRRKAELLHQLQQVSKEVLASLGANDLGEQPMETLEMIQQRVQDDSVILGGALYTGEGELIGTFGEAPIVPESVKAAWMRAERNRFGHYAGDRYDTGCLVTTQSGEFLLLVRHNASSVRPELIAYLWRITGLIVLIAIVVTLATMLTLGKLVIAPILNLRDDLLAASEVIGTSLPDPQFRSLARQRQDEISEVSRAFYHLYERVRQEICDRMAIEAALRVEQNKSEELLLNILPASIAAQLKQEHKAIARRSENVTILFADLVDFTPLSARLTPQDLVNTLNQIFSTFDRLAEHHGLEKIKTIGDAYMVAGGIPEARTDHAVAIAHMALDMQAAIQHFQTDVGEPFQLRIGIATGMVVSGVIGLKKFSYDLWGNVVNIASRMESQGLPNHIQLTEVTYSHIKDHFHCMKRGTIIVKGWGEMTTYFLQGRKVPTWVEAIDAGQGEFQDDELRRPSFPVADSNP